MVGRSFFCGVSSTNSGGVSGSCNLSRRPVQEARLKAEKRIKRVRNAEGRRCLRLMIVPGHSELASTVRLHRGGCSSPGPPGVADSFQTATATTLYHRGRLVPGGRFDADIRSPGRTAKRPATGRDAFPERNSPLSVPSSYALAMHLHVSEAIILHHLDCDEAGRRRFGFALELFAQVRLHWSSPRSGELIGSLLRQIGE